MLSLVAHKIKMCIHTVARSTVLLGVKQLYTNGGVLKLEDLIPETTEDGESILRSTRDVLKEKHPLGKDPDACSLVDGVPEPVNPITFDGLDADAIRQSCIPKVQLAPLVLTHMHEEDFVLLSNLPRIACVPH